MPCAQQHQPESNHRQGLDLQPKEVPHTVGLLKVSFDVFQGPGLFGEASLERLRQELDLFVRFARLNPLIAGKILKSDNLNSSLDLQTAEIVCH